MNDFIRKAQEQRAAEVKAPSRRRSLLPSDPPDRSASHAELVAWATVALGLGEDPITGAIRYGAHLEARMVVTLRSEARITFDRQADTFDARKLVQTVIARTGAEVPHYSSPDAQKIATVLIRCSSLEAEDDDRAEARGWTHSFLERASRNTLEVESFATPAGRWQALSMLSTWAPPADAMSPWAPAAARAIVLRDTAGWRLVRVSDVGAHVRAESGSRIAWATLHSRLVEIGWEHARELEQRQPGGHGKRKAHVYLIPPGWEDE